MLGCVCPSLSGPSLERLESTIELASGRLAAPVQPSLEDASHQPHLAGPGTARCACLVLPQAPDLFDRLPYLQAS